MNRWPLLNAFLKALMAAGGAGVLAFIFTFDVSYGDPHGWWANGFGNFLSGLIFFGAPLIVFVFVLYKGIHKDK